MPVGLAVAACWYALACEAASVAADYTRADAPYPLTKVDLRYTWVVRARSGYSMRTLLSSACNGYKSRALR